jgi:predicted transcriptional regulator
MLKLVKAYKFRGYITEIEMSRKSERDYVARHIQIKDKLMEMASGGEGCFPVAKLAAELGMDQRTVRAHLKILELDNAGVFVDSEGKEFCTKEGVSVLARRLGLKEISE